MAHSASQAIRHILGAALLAATIPAFTGCGGAGSFGPSAQAAGTAGLVHPAGSSSWTFTTLDNPDNPNYNELLAINNVQKICGFSGSGSQSDPSRGYCVADAGNSNFKNENYPGALDTEVAAVNNTKAIAGWYVDSQNPAWIFGFIEQHGVWNSYRDIQLRKDHTSNVTKLLGLSDAGLAVGYYVDDSGVSHGFELNETTGKFHGIAPPGGVSVEATGINGKGDVVGWMTTSDGSTKSFLLKGGAFTILVYPHATSTEALAVNWQDQIVGSWVDAGGQTHGFIMSNPLNQPSWTQIDDPKASGPTVIASVENHDYMVGYYVDADGHTDGFVATPQK